MWENFESEEEECSSSYRECLYLRLLDPPPLNPLLGHDNRGGSRIREMGGAPKQRGEMVLINDIHDPLN